MPELTIFEIIKNSLAALTNSKVFILIILEIAILLVSLVFSRLMDRKVVKTTSIVSSLVILGFYITNYVSTLKVFIDNVSTKIMEVLYFPTTLEFIITMIIGIVIMIITLLSKKNGKIMKIINTIVPISISFIFLGIIEYINTNRVAFDEFSTFTNPTLMSMYELAMGLFATWMIGLFLYKVNKMIIKRATLPKMEQDANLVTVHLENLPVEEEEIELPRLKSVAK